MKAQYLDTIQRIAVNSEDRQKTCELMTLGKSAIFVNIEPFLRILHRF